MYSVGLDVDKFVFTKKILLYAGNSYISSPLVFLTLGIIYLSKKYMLGQSAGNFGFSTMATAVTKNTYNKYTDLPKISEHVPIHKSNLNDEELGYFLAGLIEGDGWFGKKELHIIFSENDASLAYYIKKRIGHGNVYNIKNKKAVRYICKNTKGLFVILSLINGKFVSNYKYEQLIKHNYSESFNIKILPPLNTLSLNNYWLAGFTQADGCFHISTPKSKTHKTGYSVRLEYSLKQNDDLPLKLLYNFLNMGCVSQYSSGIWCYKSSGFKTAASLIDYFDKYNLFAGKYINYLKFRKVYIMVTEGKHLDDKGIKKIISIATKGSSETSTQEI
jgi:LAGLIDADG endonuclease